MNILVLASQKGGTGKTTLSGHLAVEAHNAGVGPVALIDTDPQGSLSQWWNARKAPEPLFVKVGPFELAKILEDLTRSGIKLAVIDTPPAITESISYVIGHADLVILPTRPSPHDLRAVGPTVDIAGRYDKPLLFVVNAATPRAHHGRSGRGAVAARNRARRCVCDPAMSRTRHFWLWIHTAFPTILFCCSQRAVPGTGHP